MDLLWGLKYRQNKDNTMDNPDHATPENHHRSLKSNIDGNSHSQVLVHDICKKNNI